MLVGPAIICLKNVGNDGRKVFSRDSQESCMFRRTNQA